MKKLFSLISLVFILSFVLTSCEKEEDETMYQDFKSGYVYGAGTYTVTADFEYVAEAGDYCGIRFVEDHNDGKNGVKTSVVLKSEYSSGRYYYHLPNAIGDTVKVVLNKYPQTVVIEDDGTNLQMKVLSKFN